MGILPYYLLPLRQLKSSEVFLRWQFEHLTTQRFISIFIRSTLAPPATSKDTVFAFPFTWSKSRTLGSFSPQSTQGCSARYEYTKSLAASVILIRFLLVRS